MKNKFPNIIYILEQTSQSVKITKDKDLQGLFVVSEYKAVSSWNGYCYNGLAINQVFDTVNEAKLSCLVCCGSDLLKTKDISKVPNTIPFDDYLNDKVIKV